MRITFILPGIGLVGGIKVVFEFANRLQARKHNVAIAYPRPIAHLSLRKKYKIVTSDTLIALGLKKFPNWFDLKADLAPAESISDDRYIPDADAVIATAWHTAFDVNRYAHRKGRKYYLIQHYETWAGPKDKVDETYRLGLRNITVSNWLRNTLENIGAPVEEVIPIGINFSEFYPLQTEHDSKIRILTPYRELEWKGVEDALKTFDMVKKNHENVRLVMFGTEINKPLPEEVEFHLNPSAQELNRIYNSCDIFLYTSWYEGFGLPPLEAMACKIPVVSTKVGILNDFSSEDALLYEPRDITNLVEGITKLIEDKELRFRIAESGYNTVQSFTWDKSVPKFETVLERR